MCTVGITCRIGSVVLALVGVLARIMPTPPASLTACALLTSTLPPRSQTTILPATLAGSSCGTPDVLSAARKQRATSAGTAPAAAASVASINGDGPTAAVYEAPLKVVPLPSVTEPLPSRLWVPAATVVIHGDGCATVAVAGPLLPAEAATNTPASAANRKAISTGSAKLVRVPLIE